MDGPLHVGSLSCGVIGDHLSPACSKALNKYLLASAGIFQHVATERIKHNNAEHAMIHTHTRTQQINIYILNIISSAFFDRVLSEGSGVRLLGLTSVDSSVFIIYFLIWVFKVRIGTNVCVGAGVRKGCPSRQLCVWVRVFARVLTA